VASTEILPLFPLSNVVLFPHVFCPLHVFEPRYRQMTAAALAGSQRIGMVTVRPEHQRAMAGDPPLFAVGCAGVLRRAERREDGRYDIVLLGAERFRLVEEIPRERDRLYRLARVELLPDRYDEAGDSLLLQGLRADAIDLLRDLLRFAAPDSAHRIDPRRFSGIDDPAFVSALCQMIEMRPAEKQGLLEAEGPLRRCERLVALLQFRLAEVSGGMCGPEGLVQ
jgi:Lon protease-like protein